MTTIFLAQSETETALLKGDIAGISASFVVEAYRFQTKYTLTQWVEHEMHGS